MPRREQIRGRLGIYANLQYVVRKKSKEKYSEAVKILQNTDMAIEEVANFCNVPYAGFREHILAYYPQVTMQRKVKREDAKGQSVKGQRSGNWAIHKHNDKSVEKYTKAVKLYETTSMTIDNIARVVGVTSAALRHYLKAWHPDLIIRRCGYEDGVALSQTKRYNKATADKYAEAIDLFRNKDLSIASIAAEFGLHYESLRRYLKEHYPELSCGRTMSQAGNVRHMPNRNASKY